MAPIALDDAQARLLALAPQLPTECLPVEQCLGRFLVEPLVARRTQPPADLSAMDGYAMRAADLPGPWRVVGESACGHPFARSIAPRESVRIATGALLPQGTDMVLLQEDALREGDRLRLAGSPPGPAGRHIRRTGADFRAGQDLLPAGTRIGPAQIALCLAAGHAALPVRRLPCLTIIDSGDELATDPEACAPHQIPASNGAMLAALVRDTVPCRTRRIGPVPDRLDALVSALAAADDADVIVTSGGASVGDHDLIGPALGDWGADLAFWKVAIKPGKPVLVARKGSRIVLGLPGNPVSSHVTAHLFLLPLLRAMLGASRPLPPAVVARAGGLLPAGGARREFLRGCWDGESVIAATSQDSGALGALATSNALIDRPAHAPEAQPGERVLIHLIGNGGIA